MAQPIKRVIRMEPGEYAFGEKPVMRVEGTGAKTSLWIGLDNINGSCLGTVKGGALDALLDALMVARGKTALPERRSVPAGMGRAAETTRVAFDGRRKRGPA